MQELYTGIYPFDGVTEKLRYLRLSGAGDTIVYHHGIDNFSEIYTYNLWYNHVVWAEFIL